MADVQAYRHDYTIQGYFEDVVAPAAATLEAKIEELGRSDWGPAPFAQADLKNMLRETMLAFSLSIQSIWERQLRTYLIGCASELRPGEPVAAKLEKADWSELCKWFRRLRGINLEVFPAFRCSTRFSSSATPAGMATASPRTNWPLAILSFGR